MTALLLTSLGCSAWRPLTLDGTALPERVRVVTASGPRVELGDPVLEGDSVLAGRTPGGRSRIPLGEIRELRGRSFSFGRTLVLAVAGGYVLTLAVVVAALPRT